MSLLLSETQGTELLLLHIEAEIFSVLKTTLDRTQQLRSDTLLTCSHGSVAQLTSLCSKFRLECLIYECLLITQQEHNTPPLSFSVLTHMSFNVLILNHRIKPVPFRTSKKKKIIYLYKGFVTMKPLRSFYLMVIKNHSIKMSSSISFSLVGFFQINHKMDICDSSMYFQRILKETGGEVEKSMNNNMFTRLHTFICNKIIIDKNFYLCWVSDINFNESLNIIKL